MYKLRKATEEKSSLPDKSTCKATSKYSADELLDKADEFLETFEHDMARRFCQRALEIDSVNCRALEMSGLLFLQAGDVDLAKNCYQRAVEQSPEVGHVKYMYLGQLSSGVEAIQYYQKGIELMTKKFTEFQTAQVAEKAETNKESVEASDKSKEPGCDVSQRDISSAYCAIAEIFLTDACFEEDAEARCKESLEKAVEVDAENAEAHHLLASYWLCKNDRQKATEAIDRGVSLWLPQLRAADQPEGAALPDPVQVCPVPYPARIGCCKTLIELENYEVASEILELLLDEDDQVVEVWYLLAWLNYLRGPDFKSNARHYLQKGLEIAKKTRYEDEQMISHMMELQTELGPEEEQNDGEDDEMTTESEDEDEDPKTNGNEEHAMDH